MGLGCKGEVIEVPKKSPGLQDGEAGKGHYQGRRANQANKFLIIKGKKNKKIKKWHRPRKKQKATRDTD